MFYTKVIDLDIIYNFVIYIFLSLFVLSLQILEYKNWIFRVFFTLVRWHGIYYIYHVV